MQRTLLILLVAGLILIAGSPFVGLGLAVMGMVDAFRHLQQNGTVGPGDLATHLGSALKVTFAGFLLAGLGVGLVFAAALLHFATRRASKQTGPYRIDFSQSPEEDAPAPPRPGTGP